MHRMDVEHRVHAHMNTVRVRKHADTHNHIEVSVSWTKMHTNTCAHASASIDKVGLFVCFRQWMDLILFGEKIDCLRFGMKKMK